MANTVAQLAETHLKGVRLDQNLDLKFEKTVIKVESNSAELIQGLAEYYKEFTVPGAEPHITVKAVDGPAIAPDVQLEDKVRPRGKRVRERFAMLEDGRVAEKIDSGLIFMFGGGVNCVFGPCAATRHEIVNYINNRFIERRINQGGLLFHAAGACLGSRGVCMAGFPGAGKSTLALHTLDLGADFVSGDRMVVAPGPRMVGTPKHPSVNPGTVLNDTHLTGLMTPDEIAKYKAMPKDELWNVEHKYDALIHHCYGIGRFKLDATMEALVVLDWKRTSEPVAIDQVDLTNRPDLFKAFIKDTGLFFQPDPETAPDFSPQAYAKMLGKCPVYEITGGVDFKAVARFCLERMSGR